MAVSHAGLVEDQDLIEGYEAYYEWSLAERFVDRPNTPWKVIEWFGPEREPTSVVRVAIPGVSGIDAILGGHLHIVLNPPQVLTDPSGRKVILSHGGAFSKFVNRIDAVIQMPAVDEDTINGAEILSFDFQVFPIDALWCSDTMHRYYKDRFWEAGQFIKDEEVQKTIAACQQLEDRNTVQLLMPYVADLDIKLNLTSLFAYAPADIARRNNSSGGDSPLGNITADSMRRRQGVEAEVAVTNTLGIRDNLYAGPLTQEAMFNVFPFENTINIMFLSGRELQEVFDFITERSATRGCTPQAQVSGARFTMDCAQAQLNAARLPCSPSNGGSDCPNDDRSGGRSPWQCIADATTGGAGGRCWSHSGINVTISGKAIHETDSYRVAVNDYIARGGSGFLVLKRNTTRVETGIPLRDSLIGYMQNFCSCDDLLGEQRDAAGNSIGRNGQPCGFRDTQDNAKWIVPAEEISYCEQTRAFTEQLRSQDDGCSCADVFRGNTEACSSGDLSELKSACLKDLPPGPTVGRCSCRDALAAEARCGNVTRPVRNFCENPMGIPVAIGREDGRIVRKVK